MKPQLSVIMPAYNEQANIGAAIARTVYQLESLGLGWELILVDDGSQDLTFVRMKEAAGADGRVRVLRLSRNFGSHIAITAGLEHARGEACLVITSDLEEPAEKIPDFIRLWRAGYEIVWGVRTARKEPLSVRLSSALFHVLFRLFGLTGYYRQAVGGGFFLVDARVVNVLRRLRERNRTVVGLLSWVGFSQTTVLYEPGVRQAGRSKWTFARRMKLAIDSFVAFSYVPIRLVSALGITIAAVSFAYGLFVGLRAFFGGVAVQGWPTLMVTVLFLGGIQLLVSGMLGEYLWRALDESRGRPLYIVAEGIGFDQNPEAEPARVG
jgi:glycosyltransferase involved in cell wall biosynthesis